MLLLDPSVIENIRRLKETGAGPTITPMAQRPITAPQPVAESPGPMLPVAEPSAITSTPVAPQRPRGLFATPEVPVEYKGFFSPEEIKKSSPGKIQSLLGMMVGESPQNILRYNLDDLAKRKEMVGQYSDLAEQRHMQAEQMKTLSALRQKYSPPPNETPDQMRQRLAAYATEVAILGRPEAQYMAGLINSMSPGAPSHVPGGSWVQGSNGEWKQVGPAARNRQIVSAKEGIFEMTPQGPVDVATGEPWKGGTLHPNAQPQWSSGSVQAGVEGQPAQLVVTSGPRIGETLALPEVDKSKAQGIRGQATQVARVFGGIGEMHNAKDFMDSYEADLARGYDANGKKMPDLQSAPAVVKQMLGSLGTDVGHQTLGAPAFAALAMWDPRFADYVRFGMSFAEGEGLISQRPSDFRQKVSQMLATARAGMSPSSFAPIRSRRDIIVSKVEEGLAKSGGPSGGTKETTKSISAEDYQTLVSSLGKEKADKLVRDNKYTVMP